MVISVGAPAGRARSGKGRTAAALNERSYRAEGGGNRSFWKNRLSAVAEPLCRLGKGVEKAEKKLRISRLPAVVGISRMEN